MDLGGHHSAHSRWALFCLPRTQKRSPELRVFLLGYPTPGPQHCSRKNLREIFRGPCALGRPHSQLPPQIARLIPTRCPEDQSRKASLIRAGFLCSAAHGDFSIHINDHQTPWPLSCFIFSFSAFLFLLLTLSPYSHVHTLHSGSQSSKQNCVESF